MSQLKALTELNIKLPKSAKPVGAYSAYKKIGKLIFISGQLPFKNDGTLIKGKVGKDMEIQQAKDAAYNCCLNILAQLNEACENDLNKVTNCVKITGYVNSSETFVDQASVLNSASELLQKVFGEKGVHARAAVSVNSLPLGALVEIEAIFEIK